MKAESEKSGLKLNIPKTKTMTSGFITSWQIEGEKVETMIDFFSWAPKSLWAVRALLKWRHLLLGRKAMTNLDSILKSNDIALWTEVCLVIAMVFPVVVYGCENWTIKKDEHRIIDAFELWCGEGSWEFHKLQGDPTSPFWRRSALGFLWKEWWKSWNSSTLDISCEELTHWKRLWCWEVLGTEGEGEDGGWDGWMASLTWWTWVWVNSGSWWWAGRPGVPWFMGSQRVGHDWVAELNWHDKMSSLGRSLRGRTAGREHN